MIFALHFFLFSVCLSQISHLEACSLKRNYFWKHHNFPTQTTHRPVARLSVHCFVFNFQKGLQGRSVPEDMCYYKNTYKYLTVQLGFPLVSQYFLFYSKTAKYVCVTMNEVIQLRGLCNYVFSIDLTLLKVSPRLLLWCYMRSNPSILHKAFYFFLSTHNKTDSQTPLHKYLSSRTAHTSAFLICLIIHVI